MVRGQRHHPADCEQKLQSAPPPTRRRLQRDKDFTGERLTTFREVFARHGLPGLILAVICVSAPFLQPRFLESLEKGVADPTRYTAVAVLIFAALNAYAWWIDRHWSFEKLGWIIYLGALSFWEEWVFRIALPETLQAVGALPWIAAIISAAIFGGLHYFTLRWKWPFCVGAFVGSLMLTRQMNLHNDLLLITAIHWVATYLNTPRPPRQSGTLQTV